MKLILYFLLATAGLRLVSMQHDSIRGRHVPQPAGGFILVPKKQFEPKSTQIEPSAVTVTFYLYTSANPTVGEQIFPNDATALAASNFNKDNPTHFIIHGWISSYKATLNPSICSALLGRGAYNVFSVDWSAYADTINYEYARSAVPDVGKVIGNFIDFLNNAGGMSFSTLILYGHSLGAHAAGYAGKTVTRGKINTIIGMDPALPLFSYKDCTTRLCSTDAIYVEAIHTCGGRWGMLEPIGHADFYVNGGKQQPGCTGLFGVCSHLRSYKYVAEAIKSNSFSSMKCSTYQNAVDTACGSTYSSTKMVNIDNIGTSGYFYTPVNSDPLHGKNGYVVTTK